MSETGKRRIIVGIDGSANSEAALRWAAEEAQQRGGTLVAVAVYHPADQYPGYVPSLPSAEGVEAAREALERTLGAVMPAEQATEVERRVEHGDPVERLLNEADEAELIVVGARGHGGLRGLGSVAQSLARHTHRPLVVVPAPGGAKPE
jgi:nucleotide-binding universal stress UspA family protein